MGKRFLKKGLFQKLGQTEYIIGDTKIVNNRFFWKKTLGIFRVKYMIWPNKGEGMENDN